MVGTGFARCKRVIMTKGGYAVVVSVSVGVGVRGSVER